jgi:hypothetical protein
MCQVEVIVNEPGSPMTLMSNPSVTSAVFTAGIVISPSLDDVVRVYKNGSFVNVTLTMTVPFTCASHISQHDCHLTVQVVQPDDGQSQPVAISQCQLSMDSTARQESQHFLVVPVTDFVRTNSPKRPTVLQLVVSSYGDAWWHGYQLPNITIQVFPFLILGFAYHLVDSAFHHFWFCQTGFGRSARSMLRIHSRARDKRDGFAG